MNDMEKENGNLVRFPKIGLGCKKVLVFPTRLFSVSVIFHDTSGDGLHYGDTNEKSIMRHVSLHANKTVIIECSCV